MGNCQVSCVSSVSTLSSVPCAYVDSWDILNNFCFHVYAQKSLFIGENEKIKIWTASTTSPVPVTLDPPSSPNVSAGQESYDIYDGVLAEPHHAF